jgi:hypothetical protein
MNLQEFKASLTETLPPKGITPTLTALWHAGKSNWEKAHTIAQDIPTHEGSWVHAYLHREEGDKGNAQYWYDRAGRKMPSYPLGEEWDKMVAELLASH